MTYPTVFANLAAGNQPASLLDTMFNIAGEQGNLACTATGTNAISLTPQTNIFAPAAYVDGQLVTWQAAATSTGSVTMQLNGLGFLNYYNASGIQAGSGDIVINNNYLSQYRANLNSGNGGFITLNSILSNVSSPVQGSHKNVKITNGGTPASQIALTADAVIVQNASGGTVRVTSLSVTISTATTGANALDAGTIAASTFYSVWAIFNATSSTAAGLISLSATAPTLPSGYTYQARVGWVLTDGSANLYRFLQLDRSFRFTVGTNPANLGAAPFAIATTTAGTYSVTSPTLSAFSLTGIVPSTAVSATILANNGWKGSGATGALLVAPNTSYGGSNNGPQGTNGNSYPIFLASSGTFSANAMANIVLEATTIAIAIQGSGAAVQCIGWDDNI